MTQANRVELITLRTPGAKRTASKTRKPAVSRVDNGSFNNNSYNTPMYSQAAVDELRQEVESLKRKVGEREQAQVPQTQKHKEQEYSDPDISCKSNWVVTRDFTDDGVTQLGGMEMRCKLRPPNADPQSWPWGSEGFTDKESLPKRASSLYLEHLQGMTGITFEL